MGNTYNYFSILLCSKIVCIPVAIILLFTTSMYKDLNKLKLLQFLET